MNRNEIDRSSLEIVRPAPQECSPVLACWSKLRVLTAFSSLNFL